VTIAAAAQALRALRQAGALVMLPPELAPRDEAEGVAVQRAHAALLGADPPGGFKIGGTAKRMQDYLGITAPMAGFMEAVNIHATGATLPWAGGCGVECEIAVRLARDLPPGPCTQAQAEAAVGEVFAAIELVENRYGPPPMGDLVATGVPTLVADQVYHRAAIIGLPCTAWRTLDLAAISGRITVNGTVRAAGIGAELLGHPMNALAWLANSATAQGFGGLRAGQVMMLGSVTPPIWLDGPGTVIVAFAGLGEVVLHLR
jgi:2-keto-4-pentenoate hydratase